MPNKSNKAAKSFLGILIILVIIVGVVYGAYKLYNNRSNSNGSRQAVFLTNGQVYFGYTQNESAQYVTVTDIYYLQVQQPLQQSSTSSSSAANTQVSLVKLGNELHGPKDEMRINRDQVVFIEDLKDNSKVNDAIKSFQTNGSTSTPSPTVSPK